MYMDNSDQRPPQGAVPPLGGVSSCAHAAAGASYAEDMLSLRQELQTLRSEMAALSQQLRQLQGGGMLSQTAGSGAAQPLERRLDALMQLQRNSAFSQVEMACHAHVVASIHSRVFPPLRNALCGRQLALAGSGPSLLQAPAMDGCLTAACNQSYTFFGASGPDYYFATDYRARGYIENALRTLPADCGIFLGYNVSYAANPTLEIPLILGEDPRVSNFCDYYSLAPRMELELYPVFHCYTVLHSMLHIALYMNPDVIYLLGCDSVPNGYFDGRDATAQKSGAMHVNEIKYGYVQLRNLQRHQRSRTRIVSVNPIGLRGFFEDVYTPQFLALHPEIKVPAAQIIEHI